MKYSDFIKIGYQLQKQAAEDAVDTTLPPPPEVPQAGGVQSGVQPSVGAQSGAAQSSFPQSGYNSSDLHFNLSESNGDPSLEPSEEPQTPDYANLLSTNVFQGQDPTFHREENHPVFNIMDAVWYGSMPWVCPSGAQSNFIVPRRAIRPWTRCNAFGKALGGSFGAGMAVNSALAVPSDVVSAYYSEHPELKLAYGAHAGLNAGLAPVLGAQSAAVLAPTRMLAMANKYKWVKNLLRVNPLKGFAPLVALDAGLTLREMLDKGQAILNMQEQKQRLTDSVNSHMLFDSEVVDPYSEEGELAPSPVLQDPELLKNITALTNYQAKHPSALPGVTDGTWGLMGSAVQHRGKRPVTFSDLLHGSPAGGIVDGAHYMLDSSYTPPDPSAPGEDFASTVSRQYVKELEDGYGASTLEGTVSVNGQNVSASYLENLAKIRELQARDERFRNGGWLGSPLMASEYYPVWDAALKKTDNFLDYMDRFVPHLQAPPSNGYVYRSGQMPFNTPSRNVTTMGCHGKVSPDSEAPRSFRFQQNFNGNPFSAPAVTTQTGSASLPPGAQDWSLPGIELPTE